MAKPGNGGKNHHLKPTISIGRANGISVEAGVKNSIRQDLFVKTKKKLNSQQSGNSVMTVNSSTKWLLSGIQFPMNQLESGDRRNSGMWHRDHLLGNQKKVVELNSGCEANIVNQATQNGNAHNLCPFSIRFQNIWGRVRYSLNSLVGPTHVVQHYNTKPVVPVTKRSATSGIHGMGGQLRLIECRPGRIRRHFYVRSRTMAGVSLEKSPSGCLK